MFVGDGYCVRDTLFSFARELLTFLLDLDFDDLVLLFYFFALFFNELPLVLLTFR